MEELSHDELKACLFFMACGTKNFSVVLLKELGEKKAIELNLSLITAKVNLPNINY